MLKSIALAAALTLAAGSAAFADSFTAELQAPVAKMTKVVAGGTVWTCEGSTCTTFGDDRTMTVSTCHALGREVGALTSFSGNTPLPADRLAKCNAGFKTSPAQTAQAATGAGAN